MYVISSANMATQHYFAYPGGPYAGAPARKRPVGLVVLAILFLIGSVLQISAGAPLISTGQTIGAVYNLAFGVVGVLAGILMIIGRYYPIVFGYIIAALVAGIVNGVITLVSMSEILGTEIGTAILAGFLVVWILSIILYIIILWYLRKPHVRAFFGRVPAAPPYPTVGVPPTSPPPPPAQTPFCPTCGAQLQYVPQYQRYWCPNERKYV
jgi:MFS family permease